MNKALTIESLYYSIQENIEFIETNYTFLNIIKPILGGIITLLGGCLMVANGFFPIFSSIIILSGFIFSYHCLRYLLFLYFIKIIKSENSAIYKINNPNGDIGMLLESSLKIYSIAKYFPTIKAPDIIDNNIPENIIQKEGDFLIMRMSELQGELELRLTRNLLILKSAKSEVESSIGGTNELNAVSELQKSRLDRQIEQFEELQRVLVKV